MSTRSWDELLTSTPSASTAACMDIEDLSPPMGAESPGCFSQTTPPPIDETVPHPTPTTAPPSLGPIASTPPTPATLAYSSEEEGSTQPWQWETPPGASAPKKTPVRRQRAEKKAKAPKVTPGRAGGGAAPNHSGSAVVSSEAAGGSNPGDLLPATRTEEMLMVLTRSQSGDPSAPPTASPQTSGQGNATAPQSAQQSAADDFVQVDPPADSTVPPAAAAPTAAPPATDTHRQQHQNSAGPAGGTQESPPSAPPPPPPPGPAAAAYPPSADAPPRAYAAPSAAAPPRAGTAPSAGMPQPQAGAVPPPPPPHVAAGAGGVEPPGTQIDPAWLQAVANIVQAAQKPPASQVPRCLQWPEMAKDKQYDGSYRPDFATWLRHYSSLTRQVEDRFRSSHLLGVAVTEKVRRAIEAHYQAQGIDAADAPFSEVCELIARLFDPPDVVYRRISAFLRLNQSERRLEDYLRERQQQLNQLAADGVAICDHVERALLVNTVSVRLREKILERTDWWERTPDEIRELLRSHQKAIDSSRGSFATSGRANHSRPQRPLNAAAAAGRRDTASAPEHPVDRRELLAAAAQTRRGTLSTQDMKQYYSEAEWKQRVGPDNRPAPGSDPQRAENAHLYNRDVNPHSGRPYCVNCRRDGHTLDQCKALVKKLRQGSGGQKRNGSGAKGKGGQNKRRRE